MWLSVAGSFCLCGLGWLGLFGGVAGLEHPGGAGPVGLVGPGPLGLLVGPLWASLVETGIL